MASMPARRSVVGHRHRPRMQPGHQVDQLSHRHLRHQPAGLQHRAHEAGLHRVVRVAAEHPDTSGRGLAQREEHVERGGLARPVRPEQGDGLAGAQIEA
jgi:hypothetical protein